MMTNRIDKRHLALAAALLVGVMLLLVVWFARSKQASATAYTNIPARGMAGLQRPSTHLANTPAVLKTFPADMVPEAGSAHLLASRGDVSVYAWPYRASGVCIAHSGGGAGCFDTFRVPVNATMSDPDRVGAGHPLYVWGVTTNDVTNVDVLVSGVAHSTAVTNNAFVYVVPDNTLGPEAVGGLVAHFADGSTQSLPAP
jgi:hypothetical protein